MNGLTRPIGLTRAELTWLIGLLKEVRPLSAREGRRRDRLAELFELRLSLDCGMARWNGKRRPRGKVATA